MPEAFLDAWWHWMVAMSWQVGLLVVFLLVIDVVARRYVGPQVRMALWMLVPLKLLLTPQLASTWSVAGPFVHALDGVVEIAEPREGTRSASLATASSIALRYGAVGQVMSRAEAASDEPASVTSVWFSLWSLGVLVCLGHAWTRTRRMDAHIQEGACEVPDDLRDELARLASTLGLRRVPRLVVSRAVDVPAVVAIVRPWIVLPQRWLDTRSGVDLRLAMLHELTHVRRRDPLWNALFFLLQASYWFHPLLPIVRRRFDTLREVLCDASVVRTLGGDSNAYRRTLLGAVEDLRAGGIRPAASFVSGGSTLIHRLRWLQRGSWRNARRKRVEAWLVSAGLSALVLPMAPLDGNAWHHVARSSLGSGGESSAVLEWQPARSTKGDEVFRAVMLDALDPSTRVNCVRLHMAARYLNAANVHVESAR